MDHEEIFHFFRGNLRVFTGCVDMFSSKPNYTGKFQWRRITIGDVHPNDLGSQVFDSIDQMKKIFSLEKGDECFFLEGDVWVWRDPKDPAISLAPILCPKKGGGWAMPR